MDLKGKHELDEKILRKGVKTITNPVKNVQLTGYARAQAGITGVEVPVAPGFKTTPIISSMKPDCMCGAGVSLKKGNVFADANLNIGTNATANAKVGYSFPLNENLSLNLSANAQYTKSIVHPKEQEVTSSSFNAPIEIYQTNGSIPNNVDVNEPDQPNQVICGQVYPLMIEASENHGSMKYYSDRIDSFSRVKTTGAVELAYDGKGDFAFKGGIGAKLGIMTTSAKLNGTPTGELRNVSDSRVVVLPDIRYGINLKNGSSVEVKTDFWETSLTLTKTL